MENYKLLTIVKANVDHCLVDIESVIYKVKNGKLNRELLRQQNQLQRLNKDIVKASKGKLNSLNIFNKARYDLFCELHFFASATDREILNYLYKSYHNSLKALYYQRKKYNSYYLNKLIIIENNNLISLKKLNYVIE